MPHLRRGAGRLGEDAHRATPRRGATIEDLKLMRRVQPAARAGEGGRRGADVRAAAGGPGDRRHPRRGDRDQGDPRRGEGEARRVNPLGRSAVQSVSRPGVAMFSAVPLAVVEFEAGQAPADDRVSPRLRGGGGPDRRPRDQADPAGQPPAGRSTAGPPSPTRRPRRSASPRPATSSDDGLVKYLITDELIQAAGRAAPARQRAGRDARLRRPRAVPPPPRRRPGGGGVPAAAVQQRPAGAGGDRRRPARRPAARCRPCSTRPSRTASTRAARSPWSESGRGARGSTIRFHELRPTRAGGHRPAGGADPGGRAERAGHAAARRGAAGGRAEPAARPAVPRPAGHRQDDDGPLPGPGVPRPHGHPADRPAAGAGPRVVPDRPAAGPEHRRAGGRGPGRPRTASTTAARSSCTS